MSKSTIKANNYNLVKKALKELKDEVLLKKVPETINVKERKMYHVVLMKIRLIPGSVKNEVTLSVHKYHAAGYKKISENFVGQYDKIFVLHNPEEDNGEEEIIIPKHQITKTEAEIRQELEAENEAEIQKRVAEALEKQKEEVRQKEELSKYKGLQKLDVDSIVKSEATIDQMKAFATANNLDLGTAKTKQEFTEALVKSVEEYNLKIDQANQN